MDSLIKKHEFSIRLLEWYVKNKRKLPWRESNNPYYIWVSEVMLQQTRVDTVIPYYHRFLEKFPTITALAYAPEEDVLKAWEGLGYYSRARNLQSAVREVQERYDGVVPHEKEEICSLKGVGPYTSGAILSIAYNKPEPAVDGNVMRVLSRYFLIEEDIMKGSTRTAMESVAKELIPEGEAGNFNQALMELGATVCTPRSPLCLACPVTEHCSARKEGMEQSLPVKKKAKPPRPENRVVAWIRGEGKQQGKFLIRRRPSKGLLAQMWELPHYLIPDWIVEAEVSESEPRELDSDSDARLMIFLRDSMAEEDGLSIEPLGWLMDTEHIFSHIRWDLKVFKCRASGSTRQEATISDSYGLPPHYKWISIDEMAQYAFPKAFTRILQHQIEQ